LNAVHTPATRTESSTRPRSFALSMRVYYEDTDAGGIVYHANYLRWMERVRTEWLRALGAHHQQIAERDGLQFVVSDLEIRYLKPARLDDRVRVDLQVAEVRRASLRLTQRVWADDSPESPHPALHDSTAHTAAPVGASARPLVEASVRVAIMNRRTSRPAALPGWLLDSLGTE